MKTRHSQAGLSIPAILVIAIMVGFFVMCGIRMAPKYFEYLSVREIIGVGVNGKLRHPLSPNGVLIA